MKIEIEKNEYSNGYTCEVWQYYNEEYHIVKYTANTLEDVFDLLRQEFLEEPVQRGLNKIEEEDD